jgi:hypothetical protein
LLLRLKIHGTEIRRFDAAEDLDPVGVVEVEVTDEAVGGLTDELAVEDGLGVRFAGQPRKLQSLAIFGEQFCHRQVWHDLPLGMERAVIPACLPIKAQDKRAVKPCMLRGSSG